MADDEAHEDKAGNFAHCFIKARSDVYRSNTTSGYRGPGWQGHHVLVADCFKLNSLTDGKQVTYIRACYTFSDWDINKSPNMLGLPVLKSYVVAYKDMPGGGKQPGQQEFKHLAKYLSKAPVLKAGLEASAPHNLPCHQPVNWGHTEYTVEVDEELRSRLWNTLKKSDKKHKSAKTIVSVLGPLADEFAGKLMGRGDREGGTALNWRHRHDAARADTWFHPFFMSAEPIKSGIV